MPSDETLRREIADLGRTFGEVLRELEGGEAFALVERVRGLAKRFRDGEAAAGDELADLLTTLSGHELLVVIKAFTGFLELANLAEDRQRVRVLRQRESDSAPAPRSESLRAALHTLREQGFSAEEVAEALEGVDVELVFTAHPTEAKRKSVRSKLRAIRRLLGELDQPGLLDRERGRTRMLLRREIVKLWQTDLVRPMPPTVMEEVQRGLSFQPVLWRTAARVQSELRDAMAECYPDSDAEPPPVLRFGSWMGGDRDGHPFVTPEVTEQTVMRLRRAAIESHQRACGELLDSLSMACGDEGTCPFLMAEVEAALGRWPDLHPLLERIAPAEGYRRWLRIVLWRLEQTAGQTLAGDWPEGGYHSADELERDIEKIAEALHEAGADDVLSTEVQPWIDQVRTFGFCTARLDIRQHAQVYRDTMEEIWRSTHFLSDEILDRRGGEFTEEHRLELIAETMPIAPNLSPVGLSEDARKTLNLFRLLRRIARRFGMEALGGHVISMTTQASDLLTVLWLWKWSERVDVNEAAAGDSYAADEFDSEDLLPIVPLFETISDLQNATGILNAALAVPEYREHVRALGDYQICMIGYSDSTKDGGYLAAAWALQRGQMELHAAAEAQGVDVTFFHGRGGSLGRGGGPAARAILSLPGETFRGALRLTEQGEVLAERYDDPRIAHRHLEQVTWSALMAATHDAPPTPEAWLGSMDKLAADALAAYRSLVDHEGFVPFFRTVTPIAGIEGLAIGSRPAKRKKGDRIEDLRAIPWVFSWTQCRCLLPAWYGLGSAVKSLLGDNADGVELLRAMYKDWRFFRATIDNSTLALAKSNPPVFDRYVELAKRSGVDAAALEEIDAMLREEFVRTGEAILAITGSRELLDSVPWLQRSITVRNAYVDPLNFVQVELTRRARAAEQLSGDEAAELSRLTQRAIKGVAAGMRTTG